VLSLLSWKNLMAKDEPSSTSTSEIHCSTMESLHELGQGDHLTIVMMIYPGMYLQDFIGPLSVFESLMNRDIHYVWKNMDSIEGSSAHIQVAPTTTFEKCPDKIDVLFIPGGVPGTFEMMEDPKVQSFLKTKGKNARFITSVCTGSLILGAAGLLKGYKATSYWSMKETLSELGAIVSDERVVIDRNRITGGGVTSGIDFALKLTEILRGPMYAQAVQLYLEYDPQPPFDSGSPKKAPKIVKDYLLTMFDSVNKQAINIARKIRI
jgi:cyclohexyl-isocyanide hydratase